MQLSVWNVFVHDFLSSNIYDIFPGVLPKYFSSEWSFAQFHLPENTRYIVAFGSQNTVLIVGMDGRCVTVLFLFSFILVAVFVYLS